jgi:hypothetical protein
MVNKIAISISKELDIALNKLAADRDLPKSRLIEICLRDNPEIAATIKSYVLKDKVICEICQEKFAIGDIKIDTPAYGVICKICWANKAGTILIKHPIADTSPINNIT